MVVVKQSKEVQQSTKYGSEVFRTGRKKEDDGGRDLIGRELLRKSTFEEYIGYFTSDNESGGIENATHNTFPTLTWIKLK
jgi:hypothetical protein